MEIKIRVREYLAQNVLMVDLKADEIVLLDDDASFLTHNLLDSTGVLELVTFLEETFAIAIADDEIVPDNLDSLNRIEGFVTRKRAVHAQAA